jgi:hypothetical protein
MAQTLMFMMMMMMMMMMFHHCPSLRLHCHTMTTSPYFQIMFSPYKFLVELDSEIIFCFTKSHFISQYCNYLYRNVRTQHYKVRSTSTWGLIVQKYCRNSNKSNFQTVTKKLIPNISTFHIWKGKQ